MYNRGFHKHTTLAIIPILVPRRLQDHVTRFLISRVRVPWLSLSLRPPLTRQLEVALI